MRKIAVVVDGEPGHIYYDGRLMCGRDAADITASHKAKGAKVQTRKCGVPLCSECQEVYKKKSQPCVATLGKGRFVTTRPCQCGRDCGRTLTKKGQKYAPECKQYANNALHAYRKLHPSTDTRRKRTVAPGRVQQTWTLDGTEYASFADFAAAMKAPGRRQYR